MGKNSVSTLREQLDLSQAQFGKLFGVHPMTVSKWERDVLQPNSYQLTLINEFGRAAKAKEVRETLGAVLIGAGIAAALYLLLKNSRK